MKIITQNNEIFSEESDIISSDKLLEDIKKSLREHDFELKTKTIEGFSVFKKK